MVQLLSFYLAGSLNNDIEMFLMKFLIKTWSLEVNKLYKALNVLSFILSLVCVGLFLISNGSSNSLNYLSIKLSFDPLILVFSLSFITIIIGLIGFLGATTLSSKIRSVFTLIISVSLSLFLAIVLSLGNLFQFT